MEKVQYWFGDTPQLLKKLKYSKGIQTKLQE